MQWTINRSVGATIIAINTFFYSLNQELRNGVPECLSALGERAF
jgi:hypothetical protein